jgi:hypothetical protein
MVTWILIAIAVAAGVVALTARRPRNPMNDPEITHGTAQSTEQIANAGTDSQDRPSSVLRPLPDTQTGQPDPARHAALGSDPGTGGQPHTQLLESHEMQRILGQWKDIQAEFVDVLPHAQLLENHEIQRILGQWKDIQAAFVDEPRKSVQDADALVAELMQRLAQTFASEREQLESQWAGGDDVSTEDLRRSLRRYRSFFERLLAA